MRSHCESPHGAAQLCVVHMPSAAAAEAPAVFDWHIVTQSAVVHAMMHWL